jgi:hypothetical protein
LSDVDHAIVDAIYNERRVEKNTSKEQRLSSVLLITRCGKQFNQRKEIEMKKSIMMMLAVSLFTVGSAYAADNRAVEIGKTWANGITYFDLGPVSTCNNPAAQAAQDSAKPFNGITIFEIAKPGSGARGSCANGPALILVGKSYNGITVF